MANENHSDPSYSASSDDESYDENDEVDRDEVKEVRKLSSKDTTRIRFWRFVVTVVLLLTAFAITFATYTFLEQQEYENFVTAVSIELWFNHIALTVVFVNVLRLSLLSFGWRLDLGSV
jgi:hypothetical protein